MKIILSRKGFDSTSGGCPSPILPDGTLLSLPIPAETELKYSDLQYKGLGYDRILAGLNPRKVYDGCHLDPDIREGVRLAPVENWRPAFGQTGMALGTLRNAGVTVGDLFLFFGLFRQTEYDQDGVLRFTHGKSAVHTIYGYLQIGEILDTQEKIMEYSWHPHADPEKYLWGRNALFLASERLSLCPSLPGCGVLSYREGRVLTMEGKTSATWWEHAFLMPDHILGKRKNSAKNGGLYYQGQWQELILKPDKEAEEWAAKVLSEEASA